MRFSLFSERLFLKHSTVVNPTKHTPPIHLHGRRGDLSYLFHVVILAWVPTSRLVSDKIVYICAAIFLRGFVDRFDAGFDDLVCRNVTDQHVAHLHGRTRLRWASVDRDAAFVALPLASVRRLIRRETFRSLSQTHELLRRFFEFVAWF